MIAGDPGPLSERRKYRVVYADPPWLFRNRSRKGEARNALAHYDCLDFPALAALPVPELAADDCVLLLWAVDPLLDQAFDLTAPGGSSTRPSASRG